VSIISEVFFIICIIETEIVYLMLLSVSLNFVPPFE